MRCTEAADRAVVTVRQPTIDTREGKLVCVDRAAVDVVHLAVGSRSVGDLLQMRRLLAIVADPLSQSSRYRDARLSLAICIRADPLVDWLRAHELGPAALTADALGIILAVEDGNGLPP